MLDPTISEKIDAIDLSFVKQRLMDPKVSKGWSDKQTKMVERKYRNFLKLIASGMVKVVVPSRATDFFWHEHLLHTMEYADMCQQVFGRFIHHNPRIGEDDLGEAWEATCAAYQELFQEPYLIKR